MMGEGGHHLRVSYKAVSLVVVEETLVLTDDINVTLQRALINSQSDPPSTLGTV